MFDFANNIYLSIISYLFENHEYFRNCKRLKYVMKSDQIYVAEIIRATLL